MSSTPEYKRVIFSPGESITAEKLRQLELNAAYVKRLYDQTPRGIVGISVNPTSTINGTVLSVSVNVLKSRVYRVRYVDVGRSGDTTPGTLKLLAGSQSLQWASGDQGEANDGTIPAIEGLYFSTEDESILFKLTSDGNTTMGSFGSANFLIVEDIGVWSE